MNTISFIGSDKNAGKTTVLNYIYENILKDRSSIQPICITSIGINGEDIDFFDGKQKPTILLKRGCFFITAIEHLPKNLSQFKPICHLNIPKFSKHYVLGECLVEFPVIIEGPNCKEEVLLMKKVLDKLLPCCTLLIDGSTDRQFLAHPSISDAFYFSILVSNRKEQLQRARNLLFPLSLRECSEQTKSLISSYQDNSIKSLYFDEDYNLLYEGSEIPFSDKALKHICLKKRSKRGILYLNGSLSRSLFSFLSQFNNLSVVLDNVFLYQNISTDQVDDKFFRPDLFLLHKPEVLKIFIRQERDLMNTSNPSLAPLDFPQNIPIQDLFLDDKNRFVI